MADVKWVDTHIEITPPKKPKKLTGTRFASVLGLNPWSTAFEIWCAVTRTWEKPFEDTIYTVAGKTIEPLQIAYMKSGYMMDNLRTPTDVFGEDYFTKTYGDFFSDWDVLGGMWDSVLVDEKGKPTTVLEFKTTKRAEDWATDIPEYYAMQAALYAYLLGVNDVIMVCSILGAKDYEHPEQYVPNVNNTFTRPFKVSERYNGNFDKLVKTALDWWQKYVVTGVSPTFDERRDEEILKALRTATVNPDTDVNALVKEAEALKAELEAHAAQVAEKEKRLKNLTEQIKTICKGQFKEGDTKVTLTGTNYVWSYAKSTKTVVDEGKLKNDGLYDLYTKTEDSYRMTVSKKKEDK